LGASLAAFLPSAFVVHQNDLVSFSNADFVAHSVSLSSNPQQDFASCSIAYPGPGTTALKFFVPSGNALAFSGGFVSSGLLQPTQTFSARFTALGNFSLFDCLSGATGSVSVVAPPPPTTAHVFGPVGAGKALAEIAIILGILALISLAAILLVMLVDLPCHEVFLCCCGKSDKLKTEKSTA